MPDWLVQQTRGVIVSSLLLFSVRKCGSERLLHDLLICRQRLFFAVKLQLCQLLKRSDGTFYPANDT